MRDTEGTIGQHQNKTYNSYQSRSSINPKTEDIYSKHHRMATHHWIIICASCHNSTAPPIKLNKLSCSNTNLILLKQSRLIGQLNVPNLVSKMHVRRSGVYLYRVPTVGRPTLGFWVVPGPDSPLFCCALPISTRPQPPASPVTCRPRTT